MADIQTAGARLFIEPSDDLLEFAIEEWMSKNHQNSLPGESPEGFNLFVDNTRDALVKGMRSATAGPKKNELPIEIGHAVVHAIYGLDAAEKFARAMCDSGTMKADEICFLFRNILWAIGAQLEDGLVLSDWGNLGVFRPNQPQEPNHA